MHAEEAHRPRERRSWTAAITRELEEVGLVTLYFLICFGVILTLKKLFLADYQIEFYALSMTVISALIAAKVVVILEKTRAGTRFDHGYPLGVAVLYRTVLYTLAAFAVLFLESLFDAYRKTGHLGEALDYVWVHRDKNTLLAKLICVAVAFVGYHFYTAIDRHLGEGTLRRIVSSPREP